MDKYTIAPPAGSTNNSVGAADRPWKEGYFETLVADDVMAKGPVVDVRAFGAKGDGVTDDTAAIQAAIDSITSGRVIFASNCTYCISSKITIFNKAIILDGNNSTLLLTNDVDYMIYIEGANNQITNITLTLKDSVTGSAILLKNGLYNKITKVFGGGKFTNFIRMEHNWESFFSDIRVDLDTANFTGTIFSLYQSTNNVFSDLILGYCDTCVDVTSQYCEGLTFVNCIFLNYKYGIKCAWGTAVYIDNCIFDFAQVYSVGITNGQNLIISNSWITAGSTCAVLVHANFTGANIHHNHFERNQSFTDDNSYAIVMNGNQINVNNNFFANIKFGSSAPNSTSRAINNSGTGTFTQPAENNLYLDDGAWNCKYFNVLGGVEKIGDETKITLTKSLASGETVITNFLYSLTPYIGTIYVYQPGTDAYIVANVYYKDQGANAILSTISNNTLTLVTNTAGTLAISGATSALKVILEKRSI